MKESSELENGQEELAKLDAEVNNLDRQSKIKSTFGSLGKRVSGASQNIGSTASSLSQTALQSATQASQNITDFAVNAGKFVGSSSSQATSGLGHLTNLVRDNQLLQQATRALNVDWIIKLIDQVDIDRAETVVRNLEKKYPEESPRQIAHRLMISKIGLVASSGFATSIVPGVATPMTLIDLAGTMSLQAEMAFQIAAAYGLDLKEPARKGEILAIFGLSVGGSQAISFGSQYAVKAGFLGFLRNLPVAGAVIGASTNAAMTLALGYAACRFYESQVSPLSSKSAFEESQEASEAYLEEAVSQQIIMDQVLAQVVMSELPNKDWETILPDLQSIGISSISLEEIKKNLESPPSLEKLLEDVNKDFAIPLFIQCKKLAKRDEIITPDEAKILETIMRRLDIDLATVLAE